MIWIILVYYLRAFACSHKVRYSLFLWADFWGRNIEYGALCYILVFFLFFLELRRMIALILAFTSRILKGFVI